MPPRRYTDTQAHRHIHPKPPTHMPTAVASAQARILCTDKNFVIDLTQG